MKNIKNWKYCLMPLPRKPRILLKTPQSIRECFLGRNIAQNAPKCYLKEEWGAGGQTESILSLPGVPILNTVTFAAHKYTHNYILQQ